MQETDSQRRARLDQQRQPCAIVHEGMFVYANPAFLQLLGYASFAEIEALPVLDLVVPRHTERLRLHFETLKHQQQEGREPIRVRLTLVRSDGSQLVAIMHSRPSRFEDEETIEFTLMTEQDVGLKNTLLRLPWRFYFSVLFLLLFTVLPSGLLLQLNINNAPRVFLPPDAPSVNIDDRLREHFPSDQVMLLLFEGVALYSDGFLQALHELTMTLEANPLIDKVVSVTNQDHIGGTDDGFLVEPLIDIKRLEQTRPAERRARAIGDRFARGTLVARDGEALALLIVPHPIEQSLVRMQLEEQILAAVAKARLNGYLSAVAGQITTDVAQLRSMLRDNMIFIPATVMTGLLLIWWLFHRWFAVIVSGIVVGVVVSSTVAIYVLSGQPFNLISSIIPPLLSALTIAALVHLFNALHYASRRGLAGKARVERALHEVRKPALFTALTTIAGLASLGLSPIPPISVFGMISATGVALIYFIVIHVVPPIFARYDFSPWSSRGGGMRLMDRFVERLFGLGVRHPVTVTVGLLLGMLVAAPQILDVQVETNLQKFFHPGHPVRVDNDHVERLLVGTTSLDVVFTTAGKGGLKDPELLRKIRAFQQWVESQPEVDHSVSMADFIEEMNWGFHSEQPQQRRIPDDRRLISQYLLVYDGEDLYDFVDEAFQVTHVNLSVNVHGAHEIADLMDRIRDYLRDRFAGDVEWELAGVGRLFADQEELLVRGQVYSLGGALLLILLLMYLQWRSIGGALLCMIPNLSPILLIFIVMGVFGIWLDMATAMIASVAVGIAVDDTIHVYHGFVSRVGRGVGPVLALARTYRQAGRAVMTTTIILSAQFLVLVTSQFVPTTQFGLLTCIGLVAALLFDLMLLPALLILSHNWRNRPLKSRQPLEL